MPARSRSAGYDAARARLIAYRYARDPLPRIRVRLPRDPIARRSLDLLAAGTVLLLVGFLLNL